MKFDTGQEFQWEGNHWQIMYCDEYVVLLRHIHTEERIKVSIDELERAYNNCQLIPEEAPSEKKIPDESLLYSDLNSRQRKIITQRMTFVLSFISGEVTVENASNTVNEIAKRLKLRKPPGVSSVRRWVTTYKVNDNNQKSLVDKRSDIIKG